MAQILNFLSEQEYLQALKEFEELDKTVNGYPTRIRITCVDEAVLEIDKLQETINELD